MQEQQALAKAAYQLACQLTGQPAEAADIAQDAMHQAWLHKKVPPRFPLAAGKAWIFRVVRNRVIDWVRQNKRRPKVELDALSTAFELAAASSSDPDVQLEQQQQAARLHRALAQLDSEPRTLLLLRDYHDLSYQQIADVLDIPQGTVMSRLHRARVALRNVWNQLEAQHDS